VLGVLTALFWALWVYLVLPLAGLLLWAVGVRLFVHRLAESGYRALLSSLLAYSSVLLILVGLLVLWMAWNIMRYGGSSDRRTARRPDVPDPAVAAAFRIDGSLLDVLRSGHKVRIDLDADDRIVVLGGPTLAT
jgi:biofilm PGA synthesis protein PgaD